MSCNDAGYKELAQFSKDDVFDVFSMVYRDLTDDKNKQEGSPYLKSFDMFWMFGSPVLIVVISHELERNWHGYCDETWKIQNYKVYREDELIDMHSKDCYIWMERQLTRIGYSHDLFLKSIGLPTESERKEREEHRKFQQLVAQHEREERERYESMRDYWMEDFLDREQKEYYRQQYRKYIEQESK